MNLSKKSQNEGFVSFFENPSRESLRELLKSNIGETNYLDFKEEWVSLPKIAKHILAFANTGGGALIVGIKEDDDGTATAVGLNNFIDKTKIAKGVSKFLPSDIVWDVYDFAYEASEYPKLKGKKFQALLIEYTPKHIPFLCKKDGDGVKNNVVYVRTATSTTEATHTDIQEIINKRIETGYSSSHVLNLSQHFEQLRELYALIYHHWDEQQQEYYEQFNSYQDHFDPHEEYVREEERNKMYPYYKFIEQLIETKRKKISQILNI